MAGAFLTEDILIYIFIHLPLISICKLKCVSKVWSSILSDPYFITKWFHFNNKNQSLPWIHYHTSHVQNVHADHLQFLRLGNYACYGLHSEFISRILDRGFSFRFLTDSTKIKIENLSLLGSSNGLVLCYTTVKRTRRYYVCNPLTQKWVSIPSPPNPMWCHLGVMGFFCEYSTSYTSSCYKVVRIRGIPEKIRADIFCSNSGEWNSFEVSCPINILKEHLSFDDVVARRDSILYWINQGHRIITCDIKNNRIDGYQCRTIELPDDYSANPRDRILGESEGLVCYARIERYESTLSVWVLKEDNWEVLGNDIELHNLLQAMDFQKRNTKSTSASIIIQVLGFNPKNRYAVLFGCLNYIWEFNIQTGRYEELCCPSLYLDNSNAEHYSVMCTPFVLNPMPTIIPPISMDRRLNRS